MSEKNRDKHTGRDDSALSFLKRLEGISSLKGDRVMGAVFGLSEEKGVKAYLVGGVIRNIALKKKFIPDYDFAVTGDVEGFSAAVASLLDGTSFLLDKETRSFRVVVKTDSLSLTVDLSPLKGAGIIDDLKERDFTLNAMALDVAVLFGEPYPSIIDPAGGLEDSLSGLVRMTSAKAFDDDPLRALRAVRIATQYGLKITPDTAALIRKKAVLLERTSSERIRDELVMLFESGAASVGVRLLYDYGIVNTIIPEIAGWADIGDYNLLEHALKTLKEAEKLLSELNDEKFPGLSKRLKYHFSLAEGNISKDTLFKMAAFFHDTGKPYAISREEGRLRFIGHDHQGSIVLKEIFERLKFSRKTSNELIRLVKNHHRVFMLAKLEERTVRAKAHLFRAMGNSGGVDLLCLSLADARATRGGEDEELFSLVLDLLTFYYGVYVKKRPRPLFDGMEIMRIFGVPEGRQVGEIMDIINEGIEKGLVKSKKGAVAYVRERFQGGGGKK